MKLSYTSALNWSEFVAVHEIRDWKANTLVFNFQPYQHSATQEHYCERIAVGEDYFAIVTGVGETILVNKESVDSVVITE